MALDRSHLSIVAYGAVVVFGLFLLTATTSVYAQSSVKELSGTYVNRDAGVEVTFPDGWSGNVSESRLQLEGLVIPGGFTGVEPTKAITLVMYPKPSDTKRDPFDQSKATNGRSDCDVPSSIEHRTVSGVDAADVMVECKDMGFTLRTIGVETNDKWFALAYYAPTTEFAADVGNFEATVDSLKVHGAVNATFGLGGLLKITHSDVVTAGGKPVEIKFATSSDIFETQLDEATKTLTFRYIGGNVSAVEYTDTEVLVGTVLKGPYVVMVDDIEATSQGAFYYPGIKIRFFSTSIAYPGIETIIVQELPGEHEVKITGTQVVPEFPTAALGVIAALGGLASLIGRNKIRSS